MVMPVMDYRKAIENFNHEALLSPALALLYQALREQLEPIEVSAHDVFGPIWKSYISKKMDQIQKNIGTICLPGVDCFLQREGLCRYRITFNSEGADPHVTFLVTGDPESETGSTFTLASICASPLQAITLLKLFCQQAMKEEDIEIKT